MFGDSCLGYAKYSGDNLEGRGLSVETAYFTKNSDLFPEVRRRGTGDSEWSFERFSVLQWLHHAQN
jgi:hypothetical protein